MASGEFQLNKDQKDFNVNFFTPRILHALVSLRCSCIHIVLCCSKEHLPGKLDLRNLVSAFSDPMRNLQKQLRSKSSTTDIVYIWYTKIIYIYIDIVWFLIATKNYSTHHLFSSIKTNTLSIQPRLFLCHLRTFQASAASKAQQIPWISSGGNPCNDACRGS